MKGIQLQLQMYLHSEIKFSAQQEQVGLKGLYRNVCRLLAHRGGTLGSNRTPTNLSLPQIIWGPQNQVLGFRGLASFLAVQDSSISNIVCLSVGRSVSLSQLTIRAEGASKSDPRLLRDF